MVFPQEIGMFSLSLIISSLMSMLGLKHFILLMCIMMLWLMMLIPLMLIMKPVS